MAGIENKSIDVPEYLNKRQHHMREIEKQVPFMQFETLQCRFAPLWLIHKTKHARIVAVKNDNMTVSVVIGKQKSY